LILGAGSFARVFAPLNVAALADIVVFIHLPITIVVHAVANFDAAGGHPTCAGLVIGGGGGWI
jgi:hypothetical protein